MRILALDGGGSKGVYSLGVLHEIEAALGSPLKDHFDCFYGVSTGAIIAVSVALGKSVSEITDLYFENVPSIMSQRTSKKRSEKLKYLLEEKFNNLTFKEFDKFVGIVAVCSDQLTPKIFKSSAEQAHNGRSSFIPAFGSSISDAVLSSCAATPYFNETVLSSNLYRFKLCDGGFSESNPTIFAVIDALKAHRCTAKEIAMISVGTGEFKSNLKFPHLLNIVPILSRWWTIRGKTISSITDLLMRDISYFRISGNHFDKKIKTSLLENNKDVLKQLYDLGRNDFRKRESEFQEIIALENKRDKAINT